MLQPQQLLKVSAHYADEITELRAFLAQADFAGGTAHALGELAARLQHDRSFHRDLTSHLWVLIDGSDRQMSHADLLGVLAIAAAGTGFAAEADEDAAHNLLRLVMAARRSLDSAGERSAPSPMADQAISSPASLADEPAHGSSTAPSNVRADLPRGGSDRAAQSSHLPQSYLQARQPASRKRGPAVWITAACILAALPIGLWLRSRAPAGVAGVSPAPASVAAPQPVRTAPDGAANGDGTSATPFTAGEAVADAGHLPAVRTYSRSALARPAAPRSRPRLRAAPSEAAHVTNSHDLVPAAGTRAVDPAEAASTVQAAAIPPNTSSTAALARPSFTSPVTLRTSSAASTPNAGANAVPASTLSKRLGSQGVPVYASANDGTADVQHHPRLLRRRITAASSAYPAGNANLIAGVDPADVPAMPGTPSASVANVSRAGIVRPISLGRMAANVLYSPSPAYPAAASAAHVQGEVKVQAEVGRDGNVIAARIVSGPPLLRDAALDAVQHWRYRPYVSSGKPVPMSAMAVMDFQLP